MLRWVQVALAGVALIAAVGWLPGRWITAAVALLLLVALTWRARHWRTRDYIRFHDRPKPDVTPAALPASAKLPIFASGYFSVEGKHQHFTWLQGYFRTFPTREHAVLCLVQDSSYLLFGQWPEHEVGMWYCFFKPEVIEKIRWGEIVFDDHRMPGLAVQHTVHMPKRGRLRPARTVSKTIYLACHTEEDARAILADLLYDHRKESETKPKPVHPSANGRPNPQELLAWRPANGSNKQS
ncbi:MAG: hypothetical protein D6790_06675 [Caldilineae bacterium]|nr:MAG: hypothetical protein D6790_06675 [Caldilineae bacterium]